MSYSWFRSTNRSKTCKIKRSSLKFFLQKIGFKDKIQKIDEEKSSSRVDVQKITLQMKVEQIDNQFPNWKVDLQQFKIKHIEKKSSN